VLLVEENLGQSRALASEAKRDDGRDTLFVAAFLLGFASRKRNRISSAPTQASILSHQHIAEDVLKSRSKNRQECEQVAEIVVRKSAEKIATRYS
jgi:hypothetical protein